MSIDFQDTIPTKVEINLKGFYTRKHCCNPILALAFTYVLNILDAFFLGKPTLPLNFVVLNLQDEKPQAPLKQCNSIYPLVNK